MTDYRGSPQHIAAVRRVAGILQKYGRFQRVEVEKRMDFGRITSTEPDWFYIADVYAELWGRHAPTDTGYEPILMQKFTVEAKGKKGHNGVIAVKKDDQREADFKAHGIKVCSFLTRDIVGRKKLSDADILKEVLFWLKK